MTNKMRLGILNAIDMTKTNIKGYDTAVDVYIRFLESVQAPFIYERYDLIQGQLPASPDACDAYLITGSGRGVYNQDPWIADLCQFIRDCYQAGKKLVGICFGHQILAHALGGRAEKSAKGWGLGLKSVAITGAKAWMADAPDQCSLYFVHQDQVVQLPPRAKLLGGNSFCPHAFFAIGQQVLGIQGHPEFSADIMVDLLAPKEAELTPQAYAAAVHSLQAGQPDNQLVGRWIVNFLSASNMRRVDQPGFRSV